VQAESSFRPQALFNRPRNEKTPGPEVPGGLLAGITVSGVLTGIFQDNAGALPEAFLRARRVKTLTQESPEVRFTHRRLREKRVQIFRSQVFVRHFGENIAEIGCHRKIAALIQLVVTKTFEITVNFSTYHRVSEYEHRVAVAVIGSSASVLTGGSSEFGHRKHHDVIHSATKVGSERGDRLAKSS
jgi:hypothetical protein